MVKYKLTKEDLEEFKNLFSITETIEEHYQTLEKLELEGKKETEEYRRELTFLKSILALEKSIYENFYANIEKTRALMDYLMENGKVESELNILKALINKPKDFKYQRIMQRLNSFLLNHKSYANIYIPELYKYLMSSSEYKKLLQKNQSSFLLQFTARADTNRIALTLIGRQLNNKFLNTEIMERLINTIYIYSFLFPEIEEILIQKGFQIPETAYTSLDMIKSTINLEKEQVDDILKGSYTMSAMILIKDLLKLFDSNYETKLGAYTGIIYSIFLRAILQFFDNETIMELNDKFHSYIDSEEYLEKHPTDTKSIEIIINSFKAYKKINK